MDILKFIHSISPKLLLEIGGHFGTETSIFRQLLPECDIVVFEPDPRNIKVMKDRGVDSICKLEEVAVSNINGHMDFHLSSGDYSARSNHPLYSKHDWSASSSLKKPKKHLDVHKWVKFENTITVPTIRLDDYAYIQNSVIDFIWMDVQGAEDLVLEGAVNTLQRTKYLYTEFNNNELYEGQMSLQQIINVLGNDWEIIHIFSDDVLLKNKYL